MSNLMSNMTSEFIAAKPYFQTLSPSWPMGLRGRPAFYARTFKKVHRGWKVYRSAEQGTPYAEIAGEWLAGEAIRKICKPLKLRVAKTHKIVARAPRKDFFRKNGLGGRSWIHEPGRHEMTIVFHDANRAGPHVDVHIGRFSVVYRVKPDVYSQLKYNSNGELTADSKKLLLDFVSEEIAGNSLVPQNLDHSVTNARATWYNGDRNATHYGAGYTRQVISVSTVDVYKAHSDGPIEFYAPALNPNGSMYIYEIYPGTDTRAPILIWGNKTPKVPTFEDRLHLKMVDPADLEAHQILLDPGATTAKYDGSSAYVVIGPKGTTIWSPRTSKTTGNQIEYTHKIPGAAQTTSPTTVVAMGEVMFKQKTPWWDPRPPQYLPQATGSGILNSHAVVPDDVEVEIRLYRVDKVGRTTTVNEPFWDNRHRQQEISNLNPDVLKVVELMGPEEAAAKGFEGVVTIGYDSSVNDGFKTKWWTDADDWRIDSVEFRPGDKGGVAGVVRCTSLESDKTFNLGPSQVGNQALTRDMMENPDAYEGSVLMVQSRPGHEGRAAKVVGFHDDKGSSPYEIVI